MTLVTGTIKDVSGSPDNSEWRFSTTLRENLAGTQIVSTKTVLVKPIAGVFSQAIEPGYVVVNYKGKDYPATLPNQTSIDVWDLIAITAPLPPSTVSAFGNGLATAPDAADARTKLSAEFTGNKGIPSGYASLDSGGKVPISQLPNSIMEYQGTWNASTNTPTLANGTGSAGDVYRVTVAGTQFSVSFSAGDYVIYNGSVWERSSSSSFTSTGPVTGSQLVSTVATGTAPLTVASTTQVANLNVTSVTGLTTGYGAQGSTLAVRDSNANITANAFVSTVATGTAPFTVASTTVVPNLNAERLGNLPAQGGASVNTIAARDANASIRATSFIPNFTTTATAAGTTTLVVSSSSVQEFTGTLAQTVVLPTTGVASGQQFTIINNSTGSVTVQSSGLNTILVLPPSGTEAKFTALVATPTTAANWETGYSGRDAANTVYANTFVMGSSAQINNLNAQYLTGLTSAAGAVPSSIAARDANGNLIARGFVQGPGTIATAAGTTTMTVASNSTIEFTGTTTQTVVLPTTGVLVGQQYTLVNNSTGAIAVQSSTLAAIVSIPAGHIGEFTATINTPTTAAHWRGLLFNNYVTGFVPTTVSTLSAFTASTSNAIGVGTVELGHATDTTLSRSAAGVIAVEGVPVLTTTAAQTTSNKRNTPRVGTVTSIAVPTFDCTLFDQYNITAQAVPITSFSVTGTPFDGQQLIVRIKDAGTAQAVAWGASFVSGPMSLITTTVATKTHLSIFVYDAVAAKWACIDAHAAGY